MPALYFIGNFYVVTIHKRVLHCKMIETNKCITDQMIYRSEFNTISERKLFGFQEIKINKQSTINTDRNNRKDQIFLTISSIEYQKKKTFRNVDIALQVVDTLGPEKTRDEVEQKPANVVAEPSPEEMRKWAPQSLRHE